MSALYDNVSEDDLVEFQSSLAKALGTAVDAKFQQEAYVELLNLIAEIDTELLKRGWRPYENYGTELLRQHLEEIAESRPHLNKKDKEHNEWHRKEIVLELKRRGLKERLKNE